MNSRDFVYWLQGLFELSSPKELTAEQTDLIRRHLQLVFRHEIDPANANGDPAKAAELQSVHDGVLRDPASWTLPGYNPIKLSVPGEFPPGMAYISC